MPGIIGIIKHGGHGSRVETCQRMVRQLYHDNSWQSGVCNIDVLGLTTGWVLERGSFADCMPAWNEDRTICLIFSGEEVGAADEVPGLKSRSHDIGRKDASVIVHWYEEQGPRIFSQLNGWFSGVLIDLRNETIALFSDRYGLSRIYYHHSKDGIYFASEAKAILSVLPQLRQIDQRGLAEFVSVGCVLQNRSLFPNISVLPGGMCWTFHRDGREEKTRYFEPSAWEQQIPLSPGDYSEHLTEVFSRIAPRYIHDPRPVAMSLTGGLDSRMLLAWTNAAPGDLPCYTFGGRYRECADVRIARKLAAIARQPHTVLQIQSDFFADFGRLAEQTVYLSDGTMDVSGAVELYANRRARTIAPIRLTGNYGSEILRSNVAFRPAGVDRSLFTPEFQRLIDTAAETYRFEASGNRLSFIAFKQVPWHHYARFSIERSQLTPRSPYLDNELVSLAYRCPQELRYSAAPVLGSIALGRPALDVIGTDRALRKNSTPFVSQVLKTWQGFTAKAEYAYDYGMPPWLVHADRMLKSFRLERVFLGRHKFYHFRPWYRDELRPFLESDCVTRRTDPGCYVSGAARKLVQEHTTGRRNRTLDLHKLLTMQLVERTLTGPSCLS
jgi:asparagine synthase (glutamine-hydrolysing)